MDTLQIHDVKEIIISNWKPLRPDCKTKKITVTRGDGTQLQLTCFKGEY